jgi:hypothetical protein
VRVRTFGEKILKLMGKGEIPLKVKFISKKALIKY